MQALSALVLTAVLASAVPATPQASSPVPAAGPGGEAYVAELDADWNVTRDVRVVCPAQSGCVVDLPLAHAGLAAIHVRFDSMRGGRVAVRSRLEARDGSASDPEDKTLSLDGTGFGADHSEGRPTPEGSEGPIILMAVKVPGWTAPASTGTGPT